MSIKLLHTLTDHTRLLTSAVFSPDSHRVVTANDDHTAKLWELDYK